MLTTAKTTSRALAFKFTLPSVLLSTKPYMDSCSPPREALVEDTGDGFISLQEWQGWGSVSPVPAMVKQIVQDLKALETSSDTHMSFGGTGGKLQVYIFFIASQIRLYHVFYFSVAGIEKMKRSNFESVA